MIIYIKPIIRGFIMGVIISVFILSLSDLLLRPEGFGCGPMCVPDATGELVSKINGAQISLNSQTGLICMGMGEVLEAEEIIPLCTNVANLTFTTNIPENKLGIDGGKIRANKDLTIRGDVDCKLGSEGGFYCTVSLHE